jgi:6-phosphogluconate dehydrogenase
VTYAQGLSLLQAASTEKNYGIDIREITKIWRGGCIIRSSLLNDIRAAFDTDALVANLLLADNFREIIQKEQTLLKATLKFAIAADVPCMAFASALGYLKAYASERLPANLIQAQRDLFGAHTYYRIDKSGVFHTTDWD